MTISEVFNEDCMIGMSRFPDKFFDLAMVDPPYGIGEDGRKTLGRQIKPDGSIRTTLDKRTGKRRGFKVKVYNNSRYDSLPPDEDYFNELFRVSKNQIIWGVNHFPYYFGPGMIFWDKCVSGDFSDGELAYTSLHNSTRKVVYMWNGFKQGVSLTDGARMQGDRRKWEKRIHPNQKPVLLYKWLLNNYATPGMKILDTHMGSQSSRIAATDMGVDFWGFELDPESFQNGNSRYSDFIIQQKLFV